MLFLLFSVVILRLISFRSLGMRIRNIGLKISDEREGG